MKLLLVTSVLMGIVSIGKLGYAQGDAVGEGPSVGTMANNNAPFPSEPKSVPLVLDKDFRSAKIRQGFGIPLTLIGGAGVITGTAFTIAGFVTDNECVGGSYFISAMVTGGVSLILLATGIPLWVSGHRLKQRTAERLALVPAVSVTVSAKNDARLLNLSWRF